MSLTTARPFSAAAWTLDENGGTRADSVDSASLSDIGGVPNTTGTTFTVGASFSGSGQHLETSSSTMQAGDIDFCFSGWFQIQSSGDKTIFSKDDGGSNRGYNLRFDFGLGVLIWEVFDGSSQIGYVESDTVNLSANYLFVCWHDATNNIVGISINGASAQTASTTGSPSSSVGTDFLLGSGPSGSFQGWMDDFVYLKNRFLDSSEITELWNGGTGVAFANWTPPSNAEGVGEITGTATVLGVGDTEEGFVSFEYDASGNLIIDSTANVKPTYLYTASGNLLVGSSVTVKPTYLYTASGNLIIGSTANIKPTYFYTASGKLVVGSASTCILLFDHQSSGRLTLSESVSVKPTYLYTGSGNIIIDGVSSAFSTVGYQYTPTGNCSIGGTSTVKPTYLYTASGNLTVGNSTDTVLAFVYTSSGKLILGSSSSSVVYVPYFASGNLVLGSAVSEKVSYLYSASGNLVLANSSSQQIYLPYQSSGKLVLVSNAITSIRIITTAQGGLVIGGAAFIKDFITVATGKCSLGGSAGVKPSYIYVASGLISVLGDFLGQRLFEYQASGILFTSGELFRPFDIRLLPLTGFWDLIEDTLQKNRETRQDCTEELGEQAFIGLLQNDYVRSMIDQSQSWRVVCYLGSGIFDIEIDGRRMNVNVYESHPFIIIPNISTEPQIANPISHFQAVETLNPNIVILGLNNRVKQLLENHTWTARRTKAGVRIDIENGVSIETLLYQPDLPTLGEGVQDNISLSPVSHYKPVITIGRDVVLSRLKNNRIKAILQSQDNWIAEILEEGLVSISLESTKITVKLDESLEENTPTSAVSQKSHSKLEFSKPVTISKTRVLSIVGSNSFLRNIPESQWEVLKINGKNVDIKLNNGLIFSVPLA